MDTHKNARLTPEGRGEMSVAVVDRAKQSRGCALIQYDPGDRLFLAAIIGRRTGHCSSRAAGWEFIHVPIDDHSLIAPAEIFPDQKMESAAAPASSRPR